MRNHAWLSGYNNHLDVRTFAVVAKNIDGTEIDFNFNKPVDAMCGC